MLDFSFLIPVLILVVGFALLCKGADVLVDGAVAVANILGVSPLIIGLTVVAVGTSCPELAAAIAAAVQNNGSIAIGNVLGSNIANLALIGGVSAIILPLSVNIRMLKVEIPVMCASMLLLLPMLISGVITRLEAAILLAVFFGLLILLIINTKKGKIDPTLCVVPVAVMPKVEKGGFLNSIYFILIGLIGLTLGAKLALAGAVDIGRLAGLDDTVIGLTIIAVGTSLPELVTCVVASFKKQYDISVGNLVGSNIFNTLLVIGASAVIYPLNVSRILVIRDFSVMMLVAAIFITLAIGKRSISRQGGIFLLLIYILYTVYLLTSTG